MEDSFRESEFRRKSRSTISSDYLYERRNIYQGPNHRDGIFGFDELHDGSYDEIRDQEMLDDNLPSLDP